MPIPRGMLVSVRLSTYNVPIVSDLQAQVKLANTVDTACFGVTTSYTSRFGLASKFDILHGRVEGYSLAPRIRVSVDTLPFAIVEIIRCRSGLTSIGQPSIPSRDTLIDRQEWLRKFSNGIHQNNFGESGRPDVWSETTHGHVRGRHLILVEVWVCATQYCCHLA